MELHGKQNRKKNIKFGLLCRTVPTIQFFWEVTLCHWASSFLHFNPLNTESNPICHLLALLGAHHILHVSRIRVKRIMVPSPLKVKQSKVKNWSSTASLLKTNIFKFREVLGMTHMTKHDVLRGLNRQQHSCEYLISHLSVLLEKRSYRQAKSIAVPQHKFQRRFRLCSVPCHKTIMLSAKTLPPQTQ
jgi:hypothetical protein